MNTSHTPPIRWSQRRGYICITIDTVGIKNEKIDILENLVSKIFGESDSKKSCFDLDFYGEIEKSKSKFIFCGGNIFLKLSKKKDSHWPHLLKSLENPEWLSNDEEEDQNEDDSDRERRARLRARLLSKQKEEANLNEDNQGSY